MSEGENQPCIHQQLTAPCECALAGYCNRWRREVTRHQVKNCTQRPEFRPVYARAFLSIDMDGGRVFREPELLLPGHAPPEERPSKRLDRLAATVQAAYKRWVSVDKPVRTAEAALAIHDTHCAGCEHYEPGRGGNPLRSKCGWCGCYLLEIPWWLLKTALRLLGIKEDIPAKLYMATEGCPLRKAKFKADVKAKEGCGGCGGGKKQSGEIIS